MENLEKIIQSYVQDYQDLNQSFVTELHAAPTPLEFSKFVHQNLPVVIRGQGKARPALRKWTNEYLIEKMGDKKLEISVSPDGYADSIVGNQFVEPAKIQLTMAEFITELSASSSNPEPTPVHYLQSQNSNLDSDLALLREDAGEIPDFAREVFGEDPEASNVWIGDSRAVTSMHKDPYENIYMVVRGKKDFVLMPPNQIYCLHEKLYLHASYSYNSTSKSFSIVETTPKTLIPWIPVDPTSPNLSLYPRFAHARPMIVSLEPGDLLYLPANYFHKVSQSTLASHGGQDIELAIAVNWWTNTSYTGGAGYAGNEFLKRCTKLLDGIIEPIDEEETY